MCQHFQGWLCNDYVMTQLLYLKIISHLISTSNLLLLEMNTVHATFFKHRLHLFGLCWFVSCRLVGWFPRQPVNYLFQQLCPEPGRALTLPLHCDPGCHVHPILSNMVSMINLSEKIQRVEQEQEQAALKRHTQTRDRTLQHKKNILRNILLNSQKIHLRKMRKKLFSVL